MSTVARVQACVVDPNLWVHVVKINILNYSTSIEQVASDTSTVILKLYHSIRIILSFLEQLPPSLTQCIIIGLLL